MASAPTVVFRLLLILVVHYWQARLRVRTDATKRKQSRLYRCYLAIRTVISTPSLKGTQHNSFWQFHWGSRLLLKHTTTVRKMSGISTALLLFSSPQNRYFYSLNKGQQAHLVGAFVPFFRPIEVRGATPVLTVQAKGTKKSSGAKKIITLQ